MNVLVAAGLVIMIEAVPAFADVEGEYTAASASLTSFIAGEEARPLPQMSDLQLAAVSGGDVGNPLQNFVFATVGHLDDQVARALNQVIIRQQDTLVPSGAGNGEGNAPGSFQQTRMDMNQHSGAQQLGFSPHIVQMTIEPTGDGTARVTTRLDGHTLTTLIPLSVPAHLLLNAVPFQAVVSVGHEIVQTIHQRFEPKLGSPASVPRLQR